MFHMCCSDHLQVKQTDVIIYGGNKQRQSKFDRNVITSPIIIRFGKSYPFQPLTLALTLNKNLHYKLTIILSTSLEI